MSVDATGVVTPKAAGTDQILITCMACSGLASPPAVGVLVKSLPIYIKERTISMGASGGYLNIGVTTKGSTYRVDGDPWVLGLKGKRWLAVEVSGRQFGG